MLREANQLSIDAASILKVKNGLGRTCTNSSSATRESYGKVNYLKDADYLVVLLEIVVIYPGIGLQHAKTTTRHCDCCFQSFSSSCVEHSSKKVASKVVWLKTGFFVLNELTLYRLWAHQSKHFHCQFDQP